MKQIFLLFLVSLFPLSAGEEFETLMGKETPSWKYLQTPEDFQKFSHFEALFNRHKDRLNAPRTGNEKIPKILHFVWLGSQAFPKASIERIEQWLLFHPGWKVKFWTDIDRSSPAEEMEKCLVEDFPFTILEDEFYRCSNDGEKAKILAYEILLKEGGVYADHDIVPYKPFDVLNEQLDFYCGLEELAPSILSSSVIPSTHLMAAKPHHPIMQEAALWLKCNWNLLEVSYPGQTKIALTYRILHRTFGALAEGIERGINKCGNCDVVFPTSYFNEKQRKKSSYAVHHHDAKWRSSESSFEEKIQSQFGQVIREDDQLVLILFVVAALSFLGCVGLFIYAKRRSV